MSNVSSSNSQGVRVPKLRFPRFEGEWEKTSFSEMFSFLSNNTLSRAELSDKGKIKNIHYGDVLIKFGDVIDASSTSIPFVGSEVALKKNTDYLQTGDVIFADTAEDDTVGKATEILNSNSIPVVSGLHTIPCRPNLSFVSSYLGYYLNSESFHEQLYPFMQGIKVTSISKANLGKTLISYPDPTEQRKISGLLNLITERIEKQWQLVEALKSYKRGVSNRIFRDAHDSSWHIVCLGEICNITMGQSPDSSSYNADGIGLPLVQGNADITDGITTPLRYTSNPTKVCESGSVILSVRAPVGTVSRANQRVCLGRGVCAITSANTDFIYQLLLCYQDSWKRIEQGGTFTAISGDDISSFSVAIPDCGLENRIVVFLSQLDAKIKNENLILWSLQKQKSALLQQLFI